MDGAVMAVMDEAARSREVAWYEASARGWRLEAQTLREHAAAPGMAPHARRALLHQAGCADSLFQKPSCWKPLRLAHAPAEPASRKS